MVDLMARYLHPSEFIRQFKSVFGPDFSALKSKQKEDAVKLFEGLEDAFNNASAPEISNALDVPGTTSALHTKLAAFKLALEKYVLENPNHHAGTPFNFLEFPTDVVMLAVFYYYHFKNSLIDVTEHMALRGIFLSHEIVRLWSQKIDTDVGLKFRSRRYGKCGKKWHRDITYLKIKGYNMYLYRAIDKEGNLVDA